MGSGVRELKIFLSVALALACASGAFAQLPASSPKGDQDHAASVAAQPLAGTILGAVAEMC